MGDPPAGKRGRQQMALTEKMDLRTMIKTSCFSGCEPQEQRQLCGKQEEEVMLLEIAKAPCRV